MSISSACVWEVRSTGNDANGGGYVSGGTDYSQQDAAQLSLTDVVANGTTTLTSATGGFTSAMVGNIICLSGGTGSLAKVRRQIATRVDNNTITIDSAIATGTGITGKVGGACANVGEVCAVGAVTGNQIWVKSGSYSINDAGTTAGGSCSINLPQNGALRGYYSTRGDEPSGNNRPVITASGSISTFTMIGGLAGGYCIEHLILDGSGYTSSRGIYLNSFAQRVYNVHGKNFTNSAIVLNDSRSIMSQCSAEGCSTAYALMGGCSFCSVHNCTGGGFAISDRTSAAFCIASKITGIGFLLGASTLTTNCTANKCSSHGFSGNQIQQITNCLATNNGGYGFNGGGNVRATNCAQYNNTSGGWNGFTSNHKQGCVDLSANPYVYSDETNPLAGAYLSLNSTAGGGASCRSAGQAKEGYPYLTATLSYTDIGAVQHADPAGGGLLVNPGFNGGFN